MLPVKCNQEPSTSHSPKPQHIHLFPPTPFPLEYTQTTTVIILSMSGNVNKRIKIFLIACFCLLCFTQTPKPIHPQQHTPWRHPATTKAMDSLQLNKFRKGKYTSLVRSLTIHTKLDTTEEDKKHWKNEYTLKSDHLMCYQWKCNLVLSASYSPKSQNIQLSLLLPFPLSVLNPQCVIYLTDILNVSKWIKIFLIPCTCLLCFHKHQSPIIDDNIHHEHILQKKNGLVATE